MGGQTARAGLAVDVAAANAKPIGRNPLGVSEGRLEVDRTLTRRIECGRPETCRSMGREPPW